MKKSISYGLAFLFIRISFSQDFALSQLENSPRHHEWIQLASNERTLHSFVAYPERSGNSPVVIVIHENRGLDNWARSFADQMAAAGYLAIAPDLISGINPDFPKTSDFPTSDDARKAIYDLKPEKVIADLNSVFDYASKISAGNGKVSVMGFCWGGSQTFRYATNNPNIQNALVFYGTAPNDSTIFSNINAPIYGFYGGEDQRVNASIEKTKQFTDAANKKYEIIIYEGAGHAFMRRGDDPAGDKPNVDARNAAWVEIKKILGQ